MRPWPKTPLPRLAELGERGHLISDLDDLKNDIL
jgi:hypothetical protein